MIMVGNDEMVRMCQQTWTDVESYINDLIYFTFNIVSLEDGTISDISPNSTTFGLSNSNP